MCSRPGTAAGAAPRLGAIRRPGGNVSAPRDNGTVSELVWASLGSPVGELSLACSPAGLARVRFGPPASKDQRQPAPGAAQRGTDAPRPGPGVPGSGTEDSHAHLAMARAQLAEYFDGRRRSFDLPVDWSATSPAQRQVLSVLFGTVGYGQTVTYGSLAQRADLTDAADLPARVVGQIMGANPIPVIVPCHRVVAGDGLGGYSGGAGIEIKRWLLIFEGAEPPTLDWDRAGPGVAHRG